MKRLWNDRYWKYKPKACRLSTKHCKLQKQNHNKYVVRKRVNNKVIPVQGDLTISNLQVTGLKAGGLETPTGNETGFINRNLPLAPLIMHRHRRLTPIRQHSPSVRNPTIDQLIWQTTIVTALKHYWSRGLEKARGSTSTTPGRMKISTLVSRRGGARPGSGEFGNVRLSDASKHGCRCQPDRQRSHVITIATINTLHLRATFIVHSSLSFYFLPHFSLF